MTCNGGLESVAECSEEAVPQLPEIAGVTDEPAHIRLLEAVNITDELVCLQLLQPSWKLKRAESV